MVDRMGCLWFAALGSIALAAPNVSAQSQLGRLESVRGLISCRPGLNATRPAIGAVTLRRPAAIAFKAEEGDAVNVRDTVVVQRMVDAKVFAPSSRGFGEGSIIFAPELGACTSYDAEIQQRGRRISGSTPGQYSIASRDERVAGRDVTRLLISIERGGVAADWRGGLVSFIALGREVQVVGTKLAVVLDSAGTEAFAAVTEGTVRVTGGSDNTVTTVRTGEVARFQRNGAVAVQPMANDLRDNIRFHIDQVWTLPVPPTLPPPGHSSIGRTLTFLGVGAGVFVGGVYAYNTWIKPDKNAQSRKRTGTIVLRIPL